MTKNEAKIILEMIQECEENDQKCGGPEHNSYYAVTEILESWKAKAEKTLNESF